MIGNANGVGHAAADGISPAAVLCGDLNMLRCFERSDISTMVVAWNPDEVTLRSRLCRSSALIAPPTQTAEALQDLEEIGRLFGTRPILYYGTDDLLLLVSRNRDRLDRLFRFRMPPAELVEDLVDKARFSELARRLRLPTPVTMTASKDTSFEEVRRRVPLPCVFKPSTHIGWFRADIPKDGRPRKALRAETWEQAERWFSLLTDHGTSFVIQSYVPGGEERIYSYHAFVDGHGRVLGEYAGKKIRTYPMEAGVSTYLELVDDPRVLSLGREVAFTLGLTGPMKIDFKSDPTTGRLFLLEVNPRFSLWNYLGSVCGVNLPLLCYDDLAARSVSRPVGYRTGVRWLSFGNDFRAFYRDYRVRQPLSWTSWLASFRGPKVYDVFSWSDPAPFFTGILHYARAAATKRLRVRTARAI